MTESAWKKKDEIVAIGGLARGEQIQQIADESGLSVSTIMRRTRDEDFVAEVAHARQVMIEHVCSKLSVSMLAAVATLTELMTEAHPPSVRLGAAKAILDHGRRVRAIVDLERRLEHLEGLT